MKRFIFIFVLAMIGCTDDSAPGHQATQIPINLLDVDDTGEAGKAIEIRVRTTAPNGCYSKKLEISLSKTNLRHYRLTATGTLTGAQVCPYILILKDTVIAFTPPVAGKYYFEANGEPFTPLYDTLSVE